MNYWLHRISHIAELSYPLLNNGYLTIGFSDFTSEEIIDKVLENDWGYFENKFQEMWGKKPKNRFSLWNFLQFKKGDIVIVPSWGTFSVCEITDEKPILIGQTHFEGLKSWGKKNVFTNQVHLLNQKNELYDLGFARKIKVIHRDISREKFADAPLTSRMKIRQTNALINDLKENIEESIENYLGNKPINLHSIITEKLAPEVLEIIKKQLNPAKFEKFIVAYFQSIGANDVSIPPKNDSNKEGDADIVAVFDSLKLIIYTQAKFQQGKISDWGVNQVLEYKSSKETLDDGYNRIAWLITTANTFDEKAENTAKDNKIQLINGIEFTKMLLNAGIDLLKSPFAD